MEFESKLFSVRIGGHKSDKKLSKIENITNFYEMWEKVIKFYKDYFKMIHKAAYDSEHRKGPKMLGPKQMLQRLPIALAQAKVGSTSGNLLNEIRQIIYFWYQG